MKHRSTGKIIKLSIIVGFLLLTTAVFFSLNSCQKRKLKDFNVVLVIIDTIRSDHLPFYGYSKNTAPFLNELSRKSVVFDNAFSASSWTSPATASIFTSLYPFQHRVLMGLLAIRMAKQKIDPNLQINRIPEEIDTIAEVMKEAGYRTYGVSDNLNIGKKQGFTQGFDKFETFMYQKAPQVNKTLKKWKDEITKRGKYFLYIHYMDPHAPYHRRKPWYEPQKNRQKDLVSAHDSEINFADEHLKEIFNLFGWDKNTLFIFSSDHGEGLWDHGKMGHGNTLYREELQVPLLIYLPEHKVAKRVTTLVSTVDILPTIRELIGLAPDRNNAGISLVSLFQGKNNNLEDRYLFAYLWKRVRKEIEFKTTIYQKWQFIFQNPKKRELFNLIGDKREQNNLFFQGYRIARMLEEKFNDFMKKSKKYKQQDLQLKLDEDKMKKLKSLGYVE